MIPCTSFRRRPESGVIYPSTRGRHFAGVIGLLANLIGIATAMVWFGGIALVMGLLFLLTFKDIRRLD